MKLFLSFICTDLVDERAAAERVIIAMGQHFVGMEYFFAREETPLQMCLDLLRTHFRSNMENK